LTKDIIGQCGSKHHKPWFDEQCSELVVQRKQTKLVQWLQGPHEMNKDNSRNVRWEANRHFRNKERGYLKDKIIELESNSKNKNIRDPYRSINKFSKCCHSGTNLKDERG
jgi:hypothetical protein